MALWRFLLLTGVLLLVTTFAKRIGKLNKGKDLTPSEHAEEQWRARHRQRTLTVDSAEVARSKKAYCEAFIPAAYPAAWMWVGVYIDMFSPDDTMPESQRFIDFDEASREFQISGDTGREKWGRRFNKTTSVNPTLRSFGSLNAFKTSFLSKVPEDAPSYPDALDGALNFTLTMGTAFGEKVIKWNGIYDGKGGKFAGKSVPPVDCDNFWRPIGPANINKLPGGQPIRL